MSASDIVGSMPLIWLLAGMGLVALVWDQCFRAARWFLGLFVLSAFLAVIPGFFFRPHYFLLVLPAVSTLAGLGVGSLTHWPLGRSREPVRIGIAAAIAMLCLAISFHQNRGYLLEMTPAEVSRATFGLNAFPESILIADFIRQRTVESDRIAILGSEPQIYFYARRRAATGYVYMYEMMRPHDYAARMQAEMALEIERVRPKLLLYVRIEDSWSREKGSGNYIFEWFDAYWKERYEPVGLVAMTPEWTEYHWDPDVPWPPATHLWVAIFERKD